MIVVTLDRLLSEEQVREALVSLEGVKGVVGVSRSAPSPEGFSVGYARVSRKESPQSTKIQIAALKEAGATVVYEETASGASLERPELHKMLDSLWPGDTVVVYRMDRLSRSLKDLLLILEAVDSKGARIRSLTEAVDTKTSSGRLAVQVLGAFAEFELNMVGERTRDALNHIKGQGVQLGGEALGWRRLKKVDADGRQLVEPAPEELATTQRIKELRGAGATLRAIAAQLTAEGRATKRGGKWYASTIRKILVRQGRVGGER